MKTSLRFEGPQDLSVGRIHISGPRETLVDWIATPSTRDFESPSLEPGYYSAQISPPGLTPQSVFFEVKEGVANTVAVPSFAALASTGSETNLLGDMSPEGLNQTLVANAASSMVDADAAAMSEGPAADSMLELSPLAIASEPRRFSVGLSEERLDKLDSFGPFTGSVQPSLAAGTLRIEVQPAPAASPWTSARVRLSVSIQDVRTERLLLPAYEGGVQIEITPSPLASADVALQITPINPELRALVRTLHAGTTAEAQAVQTTLLTPERLDALANESTSNPWEAMLAGLLALRFPDVFGPLSPRLAELLSLKASWAYDAHVIRARQRLSEVGEAPDDQREAVIDALASLNGAQRAGSPYYNYANQLFAELLASLEAFTRDEAHSAVLPASAIKQIQRLSASRRRNLPLQSNAGPAFSWLSRREGGRDKTQPILPKHRTSGQLRSRDTLIVAQGLITAGAIDITPTAVPDLRQKTSPAKQATVWAPGEEAKSVAGDKPPFTAPESGLDPNRAHFGDRASANGFELQAQFTSASRGWASVRLIIEAAADADLALGDVAWFCLHPTFSPRWVKVMFQGRRAMLTIRAWGGFTVGAWLARQDVKLELDLSAHSDAPKIIRER